MRGLLWVSPFLVLGGCKLFGPSASTTESVTAPTDSAYAEQCKVGATPTAPEVPVSPGTGSGSGSGTALGPQVAQLFQAHSCTKCHTPGATQHGSSKFSNILDRDQLAQKHIINLTSPEDSLLYEAITGDTPEMPPDDSPPMSAADQTVILNWIKAGAPSETGAPPPPPPPPSVPAFISEADKIACIAANLRSLPAVDQPNMRYLTLEHLLNAGDSAADLALQREAMGKLLNSLSTSAQIALPTAVDPAHVIYRLDLRTLGWTAQTWEQQILPANSFGILHSDNDDFKFLAQASGSQLPYARGDWFVFAASQAPLYYGILGLPKTDAELEKSLNVNLAGDIQSFTAVRAGFSNSGISKHNRVIERHAMTNGAYWRSYDFADSEGVTDIFANPLGPCLTPAENPSTSNAFLLPCSDSDAQLTQGNAFRQAASEMIWNLPNGLQAYFISDKDGNRLDRALNTIVLDPLGPDGLVEAGLSCIGCHDRGMNRHEDAINAASTPNPQLGVNAIQDITSLYAAPATLDPLFAADEQRFSTAVTAAGSHMGGSGQAEAVRAAEQAFEGDMTLADAAAEAGLSVADFQNRLLHSPHTADQLGALFAAGGIIKRETYVDNFNTMVQEFALGTPLAAGGGGGGGGSGGGGSTASCASPGIALLNACWFEGQAGQSCTAVCSSANKTFDSQTETLTGASGTESNCTQVTKLFVGSITGTSSFICSNNGFANVGCFIDGQGSFRCSDTSSTADAINAGAKRVCACK